MHEKSPTKKILLLLNGITLDTPHHITAWFHESLVFPVFPLRSILCMPEITCQPRASRVGTYRQSTTRHETQGACCLFSNERLMQASGKLGQQIYEVQSYQTITRVVRANISVSTAVPPILKYNINSIAQSFGDLETSRTAQQAGDPTEHTVASPRQT